MPEEKIQADGEVVEETTEETTVPEVKEEEVAE